MANPTSQFAEGALVRRKNQPEAIGIVRKSHWNTQSDEWEYSVQFGAQIRGVPEGILEPFQPIETPWEALSRARVSGIEHFIVTLTLHRLRQPPARIAHSFATSRTLFYPHQFKPLLKFLDNSGKRILIADDVGLGKTIEAGYVLRELEAHQAIERVLIVVPARLAPKWKRELQTRFDETFEIVRGADLVRQAERIQAGRELDPFRWILSYDTIRPEEVREVIDKTRLPIDVLIFDEAHRLRNPETLQHKIGEVLCAECADTVLMLSATPVQNRLEDLWHLLRLLSPEEFAEWPVFQDQMDANQVLLRAQRSLAARPPDFVSARDSLDAFLSSRVGRAVGEAGFARSVRERLSSPSSAKSDLIDLQLDLDRLSPLAHILSRTRKTEAMTNRAERDASWTRITLTDAEQEIYNSVEELCREAWPTAVDSWGFRMSLLMAYRITASCIPAAIRYFSERLSDRAQPVDFSREIEEEEEEEPGNARIQDISAWSGPARGELHRLVRLYESSSQPDSKLARFLEELELLWTADERIGHRRRKVIVFSFFRRTLEYLRCRLSERDIRNRMIHGGISIPDREDAIDDFLENPEVLVLLTSEVGGEGLDLQKASVVVNYDLPWNPMVVEQRIGRVDRIGQEAERIVIRNLIIAGSIEERVLQRLLDKIEIFRNSIGELDEIIGEEIERLTEQALRGDFTNEQLERLVEERGTVLARRVTEAKTMLSRMDGLLAADQALMDEIEAVIGERQIPAEKELLLFLNRFLAKRFSGCQLPLETLRKVVDVDLRRLATDIESFAAGIGADAISFVRRLASGPVPITLSRQAAYTHTRADLLHLHHPLVRFAVSQMGSGMETHSSAFCLSLASNRLPPSLYGFLVAGIHFEGQSPRTRLVGIFADLNGGSVYTEPDLTTPLIIELLDHGSDAGLDPIPAEDLQRLRERLTNGLQQIKTEWNAKEARLEQARRQLQAATRKATLDFLVNRAKARLGGLVQRQAGDFAVRMAQFRLEKAERELGALDQESQTLVWRGTEHEELAVGLLDLRSGARND